MVTIAPLSTPVGTPLDSLDFGARYTGYFDDSRFLDQTAALNPGLIVWPGGTLAETRPDLYGFGHEGLFAASSGRPGLAEMMTIARGENAALSVNLPTAAYAGDPNSFAEDLEGFMADLLGGTYGPLPDKLILEIGAEYYATFEGTADATAAELYGEIADTALRVISAALTDPSINTLRADVDLAVQAGKTMADDVAIRDALSPDAIGEVDMIVHHRFLWDAAGVDGRADDVAQILEAWGDDAAAAGAPAPELFVSAMGVVGLTRKDVLDRWADETGGDRDDVDLAARDNADFENYWQDQLSKASYGGEHATLLLEMFASYAELGLGAASFYGTDFPHAGRLSLPDTDGESHTFVGGDMIEMLSESVIGTTVHAQSAYDPKADVVAYAFENADRLVVFLAAGERAPGQVDLMMDTTPYLGLWADGLTAEIMPDWMDRFGVTDTPGVDETPEAWTYALGVRGGVAAEHDDDRVGVSLDAPHQVVRLSFAKTDAGVEQIEAYADTAGDIWDALPPTGSDDDGGGDDDPDLGDLDHHGGGGGGGGVGFAALLLLPLLWFL